MNQTLPIQMTQLRGPLALILVIILYIAALGALTGCSTLDSLYDRVPGQTEATQLEPNPVVETAIKGVGALPFPFAGPIALALGWVYSAYAAARNKKIGVALIQGVEAGRMILQTTPEGREFDRLLKQELVEKQGAAGVLSAVKKLVESYTVKTTRA